MPESTSAFNFLISVILLFFSYFYFLNKSRYSFKTNNLFRENPVISLSSFKATNALTRRLAVLKLMSDTVSSDTVSRYGVRHSHFTFVILSHLFHSDIILLMISLYSCSPLFIFSHAFRQFLDTVAGAIPINLPISLLFRWANLLRR